jgi:two-component system cell cycle sensor histidine kinase/response regulator CckA
MLDVPTVLIAEDDDTIRRLISKALRNEGFNVLEASHGQMALDIAAGCTENIDLLLSDVIMPGMTGPQLALTLRESRPNLKIVLMSGHTANIYIDEEGWPLLQKPFLMSDVIGELREALQGRPSRHEGQRHALKGRIKPHNPVRNPN